ncbi:hypothetical protein AXX16_0420 [Serratia rubidaea]|nr:hypothetical protein AXX16_0420 [Serratia rubidaea]
MPQRAGRIRPVKPGMAYQPGRSALRSGCPSPPGSFQKL